MIGSIVGDIIGSRFEGPNLNKQLITNKDFIHPDSRFTDDTVLTIAVMDSILNKIDYIDSFKKWGRKYINSGFSPRFKFWLNNDMPPIPSFGNGSAMRISPIPLYFREYDEMISEAKKSCISTHNTFHGVNGGLAIAECIYLSKTIKNKKEIISIIEAKYGYDIFDNDLENLHKTYVGNATCEGTVPQAIYCFYISDSFVDCIKKCVYIGGDTDTICAMSGGICEAYYGLPDKELLELSFSRLPFEFYRVVDKFYQTVYE